MRLRTSSLALLAVNASALLAIGWVISAPAEPHWLAPKRAAQATATPPPAPPPELAHALRAATWTRPIFSPDRQPDPQGASAAAQPLSRFSLTGVVLDSTSQWAYLREGSHRPIKVALGAVLTSGWTLSHLDAQSATFIRDGQTHTLSMPLLRLPPPSKTPVLTLPRTTTP
ncbi:hypothetical protein PS627_00293 [Pseudomonas fluorescens]|uniref:general secretion pathway protein GspN n=1 Tax=Pseudomonas fluorescens TaxID=294 RepID=UPI001252BFC8|nr:general secretion pathway protein GspN [Pseudomonas fluorescens]CAG8863355.1 hypothetical protein PS627_00293 [Pseudomonas fluorescens]